MNPPTSHAASSQPRFGRARAIGRRALEDYGPDDDPDNDGRGIDKRKLARFLTWRRFLADLRRFVHAANSKK